MARKQVERLLSEVSALVDRLTDHADNLTSGEVGDLLRGIGYEPDALRMRLNSEMRTIAARLRKTGKPVPRYFREVLEHTASLDRLAERNPGAAQERVRSWLRGLQSLVETGVAPSADPAAIAHAYRRSGELSPEDAQVLDEIRDELKSRVQGPVEDHDGGTHGQ